MVLTSLVLNSVLMTQNYWHEIKGYAPILLPTYAPGTVSVATKERIEDGRFKYLVEFFDYSGNKIRFINMEPGKVPLSVLANGSIESIEEGTVVFATGAENGWDLYFKSGSAIIKYHNYNELTLTLANGKTFIFPPAPESGLICYDDDKKSIFSLNIKHPHTLQTVNTATGESNEVNISSLPSNATIYSRSCVSKNGVIYFMVWLPKVEAADENKNYEEVTKIIYSLESSTGKLSQLMVSSAKALWPLYLKMFSYGELQFTPDGKHLVVREANRWCLIALS